MQSYHLGYPRNPHTGTLFPHRISRCSYLIRGFFLFCAVLVVCCLMHTASAHHSMLATFVLMGGAIALLLFLWIAFFGAILMPRLRDMGAHPAWSLLIFVPHVGSLFLFALLLIPTDAFAKQPRFDY